MTDKILKKKEIANVSVSPVIAAVAGVVIGAGAAVASVVMFNDKNNRNKVTKAVVGANDKVQEKMDQAEDKIKKVLE